MRVLHVHCRYRDAGGEDAVVDAERALLRAAGIEVVEHTALNPTEASASLARVLAAPWNPATFTELRRTARRSSADLVHVHNTWFSLSPSVLEAFHRTGLPVVMTVHNYRLVCVNGLLYRDGGQCMDCVGRSPWRGVVHRCYRDSRLASAAVATTIAVNRGLRTWARCVDRFLVLNEEVASVLTDSGLPASTVHRTSNFVGDPGPRASDPSVSRTIAFIGRLTPEKGLHVLLDAWRRWRPDAPWSLVVAGDGPARADAELLADDRVDLRGRLTPEEVRALLLDTRALALPSVVRENQPMVALESFAAGTPVLGSGLGGTLEVIRPLGPSWAVTDRTVEGWLAALDVVADDGAVDSAGAVARGEYDLRYSPAAATTRLRGIYDDVLARRTAATPS